MIEEKKPTKWSLNSDGMPLGCWIWIIAIVLFLFLYFNHK